MKNKKGITLVALVITIIVLLILAGVAISTLTGNDSVIGNANKAVEKYKNSVEEENIILNTIADAFNKYGGGRTGSAPEVAEDPGTYYGQKVKFTAETLNNSANSGVKTAIEAVEWKIFNVKNGQIQIIPEYYVTAANMPAMTGIIKSGYTVYGDTTVTGVDRNTLIEYINNSTLWTSMYGITIPGKGTATAKGGPSMEEFVSSYNAVHTPTMSAEMKSVATDGTTADGYQVKWDTDGSNWEYNISGMSTATDGMWVIADASIGTECYWLGGPSAFDASRVMGVGCGGDVFGLYLDDALIGARPLVTLPYSVTLTWSASDNAYIIE